ncbi:lytic transglycosylase domain-containing protein [Candidatus Phycosocius spiralis]|uniref:Transglycosylase SLT domain-containing protein n=1 Tax=Candidatus Phycosocius spiralis TaxID=2815099 RepID=A0ABQ4PVA2_9PROT|nr:lytic transglycosylase domain-containing protein [Candidatus Phycosocius spiralis]GIU66952.1 hypothetical protein PsB1_1106 [Candidatus Phycosocius spiralis]
MTCLATGAYAQTHKPTGPYGLRGSIDGSEVLSPQDQETYRQAFSAANSSERVDLDALEAKIDDSTLRPHLERVRLLAPDHPPDLPAMAAWLERWSDVAGAQLVYEKAQAAQEEVKQAALLMGVVPTLFNLTRPKNVPLRRTIGALREPSFIPVPIGAGATKQHRVRIDALAARFYAGDDAAALAMARAEIDGPQSGQAGWIGGLAAYRLGDFETARHLFGLAASWKAGDDWTRAAGAFWAARSAEKLNNTISMQAFLEQAASSPLTFYGQLALARLGRWDQLPVPHAQEEIQRALWLVRNDAGVRRAIALHEIGRTSEAEAELLLSWSRGKGDDDLGYMALARHMNLSKAIKQIAEASSSAALSALYPIPDQFRPIGGEFVLDRAVILAVMRQESKFDTKATSYAGARGLMQVMPRTAAWMTGRRELAHNPRLLNDTTLNVTLGEAYLEKMMSVGVISNCLTRTFMAYNAGPGNVVRWSASVKGSDDTLMFMEAAPSGQARVYAERVMSNMWIYHRRFGQRAPSLEKLARGMTPTYEPQDNPRQNVAGLQAGMLSNISYGGANVVSAAGVAITSTPTLALR